MRVIALLLTLLPFSALAGEINVFAAASLTDAMLDVALLYERTSTDRVIFNFGASSMLARQIVEGAPADVFISADEEKMNAIHARGLIVGNSRVSLLSNVLVIVVPADRPSITPRDLARVSSLALADPRSVPAGIYAETWLRRIGLWDSVRSKVIPTDNVRSALAAVQAGNAAAAIVYKTDVLRARGVRVVHTVTGKDRPAISYPFAVLRDAPNRAAAAKFLAFLRSKPALDLFRRHGFEVIARR